MIPVFIPIDPNAVITSQKLGIACLICAAIIVYVIGLMWLCEHFNNEGLMIVGILAPLLIIGTTLVMI